MRWMECHRPRGVEAWRAGTELLAQVKALKGPETVYKTCKNLLHFCGCTSLNIYFTTITVSLLPQALI